MLNNGLQYDCRVNVVPNVQLVSGSTISDSVGPQQISI